jgi:hypothetical protein
MKDEAQSSIFRVDAIKRNSRGRSEAILPQFSSPKIIWWLWSLISLTIVGGALLWFMRIPIYAKAFAIPLPSESSTASANDGPLVAVLLPARNLPRVQTGQRVFWSFSKTESAVSRTIIAVKPSVQSPDSLQASLGLRGQSTTSITEPVVVAFVSLGPVPADLPTAAYVGSVYHAEVEVGTKRVISLLPVVGRFIGN